QGDGDGESGGCAVGLGWQVGVQGTLGGGHQRVPHPGTGVAGIVHQPPAVVPVVVLVVLVVLVGGALECGCGCGEGEEGCFEQGAGLGGPSALDPDPTGAVEGDREEPGVVGGAFLAVKLPFEGPVRGVGVDHVDQVTAGAGQVGGVEVPRVLHHHGLTPGP